MRVRRKTIIKINEWLYDLDERISKVDWLTTKFIWKYKNGIYNDRYIVWPMWMRWADWKDWKDWKDCICNKLLHSKPKKKNASTRKTKKSKNLI